jgi:hypothetical protein
LSIVGEKKVLLFIVLKYYYELKTDILWHVDPLLGNDRELSNYTTAFTKEWLVKQAFLLGNNGTVPENVLLTRSVL